MPLDGTTYEPVDPIRAALLRTADFFEANPKAWHRGSATVGCNAGVPSLTDSDVTGWCMMARIAVELAATSLRVANGAVPLLHQAIYGRKEHWWETGTVNTLFNWNDAHGRTVGEVVAMLRHAAAIPEEEEESCRSTAQPTSSPSSPAQPKPLSAPAGSTSPTPMAWSSSSWETAAAWDA